ncbi:cornifelin-like [Antedon mediterranea]|uniref:cornifelin-like n=1 Tax=Antedon mediterranea TaxID=105859 RepID=UPI003AF55C40
MEQQKDGQHGGYYSNDGFQPQPPGYVQQQPGSGYIQQQPGYQQPVVTQPPVAQTHVHVSSTQYVKLGGNDWSSGLFDCFRDPVSCLGACCCPLCYNCYISDKLGESLCLPCCVPGYLVTLRSVMRTKNNIPGSVMSDCCTTCWCQCCAVTQMSRHHDFVNTVQ